jgi:hypothetical protein
MTGEKDGSGKGVKETIAEEAQGLAKDAYGDLAS